MKPFSRESSSDRKLKLIRPRSFEGELVNVSRSCGWVLCIGAGISTGVFPNWQDLATTLLRQAGNHCQDEELQAFVSEFGCAAMMQAAINALGDEGNEGDELIASRLVTALYGALKASSGSDWAIVAKALTSTRPASRTRAEWEVFLRVIGTFKRTSAPYLARVVAANATSDLKPAAIISFNAEPLLFALINAYAALRSTPLPRPKDAILDRMVHDLSIPHRDRIPVYFAHGLVPVPDGRTRFNNTLSPGKVVFTEGQYLSLSRSVYSWQAATFLSACMQHRCVFVGLSFTDPNLRRWLAWNYEGRFQERARKKLKHRPGHYWIKKRLSRKPGSYLTRPEQLVEQSVRHLGVRIVWIDEWDEVGTTLAAMLEEKHDPT